MAVQSWKYHTRHNINRIQQIFATGSNLNIDQKLTLYRLAYDLAIKTCTIEENSSTRFWGVFHNCLRIVVLGETEKDVTSMHDDQLFQE